MNKHRPATQNYFLYNPLSYFFGSERSVPKHLIPELNKARRFSGPVIDFILLLHETGEDNACKCYYCYQSIDLSVFDIEKGC